MKKTKKIYISLISLLLSSCTININNYNGIQSGLSTSNKSSSSCSSSSSSSSSIPLDDTKTVYIKIWVDSAMLEFYANKLSEFVLLYPNHIFQLEGKDIGAVASVFLADPSNGADIFMVSHENLGSLSTKIKNVNSKLEKQIKNDNSLAFQEAVKKKVNGAESIVAAPCSSQSLVLYYNKAAVTAEQAKTWEGLKEAAINASTLSKTIKATTLLETDLYNFSWPLLSKRVSDCSTTVKLFEDNKFENCNVDGDDTVSVMKWTQEFYNDPNGGLYPNSDGWESNLYIPKGSTTGKVLSLVGGPWNYDMAKVCLGDDLGITKLPTFRITDSSAYGSITSNTEFQAGTFTDCRTFVMKKNSEYAEYLDRVVQYLSSKEVQKEAYQNCGVLPAYADFKTDLNILNENTDNSILARAQLDMMDYGITQPFGYDSDFNVRYYSGYVRSEYNYIVTNNDYTMSSFDAIKASLTNIETYLKTGKNTIN